MKRATVGYGQIKSPVNPERRNGHRMKGLGALLVLLMASQAVARDLEVGLNGWQIERLSSDFIVLRTDILVPARDQRETRQGLLVLTCEPGVRRIRFQIGHIPRNPSIQASSEGRAIVRISTQPSKDITFQIYPNVLYFADGSFEFRESAAFGDSVMRGMLKILRNAPSRLEVVLFNGRESRAFRLGTAMYFKLHGSEGHSANLDGFEGLCLIQSN